MKTSLRQRLLGIGLLVVIIFAGGIGSALEIAFRDVAETLRMERLQAQIYMLLASAELESGQLKMHEVLPEPRLSPPGSGMYAIIYDEHGQAIWRSGSLLGQEFNIAPEAELGVFHAREVSEGASATLFAVSYGVAWVTDGGEYRFDLMVAEDQTVFTRQIGSFRQALWGWLVVFVVLLLAVQVAVLHWVLRPLRRAEDAVQEIVAGQANRLEGVFPRELTGLVENLNKLINNERQRMLNYRETLANLAHSLKTPLAVMKTALENEASQDKSSHGKAEELIEQVDRMNSLVEYQLAKASTSGKMTFQAPLPIRPVLDKLVRSLNKVYADKQMRIESDCPKELTFPGVEGDLMEMVGNLMDNGCKWCRQHLSVSVSIQHAIWLKIEIEDDGPGLSDVNASRFTTRGVRGDESVPGQGIGLAVVRELIAAYHGHLKFSKSRWNGTSVTLFIPLD